MDQPDERTCGFCGASLEGKRRHARFCNSDCRSKAYRVARHRESVAERAKTLSRGHHRRPARYVGSHGYVMVLDEHGLRVTEHKLVMERKLGRKLLPGESVHHRNGNRADNRPDNLELWGQRSHPAGQRYEDLPDRLPDGSYQTVLGPHLALTVPADWPARSAAFWDGVRRAEARSRPPSRG